MRRLTSGYIDEPFGHIFGELVVVDARGHKERVLTKLRLINEQRHVCGLLDAESLHDLLEYLDGARSDSVENLLSELSLQRRNVLRMNRVLIFGGQRISFNLLIW